MILVDTGVWVDHLRRGDRELSLRLEAAEVACHPFVLGELACGRLQGRREILTLLSSLPVADVASHEEALALVDSQALGGRGIGWIDVHLLASARLSRIPLWSRDRRLRAVARELGCAYTGA